MIPFDEDVELRPPYPTDLTDEEWSAVERIVLGDSRVGRKRIVDNREIVNAVLYMWASRCAWRMLPHDLPAWTTVYYYYRRWSHDGTLSRLRHLLANFRKHPTREGM